MTLADIALQAAVALAAAMQAITGIGFAMIAGPFILLALDDGSAVQVSMLHSILISVVLLPGMRAFVDRPMLLRLCLGGLAGLPFGIALFMLASVDMLKLIAGLTVGALTLMSVLVRAGPGAERRPASWADWGTGWVSGLFGGCLAMPGPTAAVRMTARGFGKSITRATILAMFVILYPLIFAAHALSVGVGGEAVRTAGILLPGTLAGLVAGHLAAGRVSEQAFRNAVLALLAATAVTLMIAAWRGFTGA